jgi:hypothetical protein
MPTRPILDPNLPNVSASVSADTASAHARAQESPLATQLPGWDLLPAHTLLVRRRPAPAYKPPANSDVPASGSKAASPPHPSPPPLPASTSVAPAKRDAFCQNCGASLEEGSTFCTGCGTKVR